MFRHYLVGRKFVIQTDHANLQWLLQQKNGRLERWAMRLLEFDFLLQFKPGKANANADALSRHPWTGEPQSIEKSTSLQPLLFSISGPENLTNAQWQDPQLSKILRTMGATPPTGIHWQHTLEPSDAQQSDEISDPSQNSSPSASTPNAPAKGFSADQNKLSEIYEVVDNQLRFHGHASPQRPKSRKNIRDLPKSSRPVLPVALQTNILELAHNHPLAGHLGFSKVYAKISSRYYWPGMYRDIKRYCQGCLTCALRKQLSTQNAWVAIFPK